MRSTIKTPLLILAAALPLAACVSFGAKPPPSLLTLRSDAAPAVGQDQNSANTKSIVVQVPSTPQSLATARVPVQQTPVSIAYVKNAQWAEPPARLFARLLSDTIGARANMVVLSGVQAVSDPSAQLAGELRSFGVDAQTRQAIVVYDASLTRAGSNAVEKHRFEAQIPVATIDAASSGTALNQAANRVAADVATWVAAR